MNKVFLIVILFISFSSHSQQECRCATNFESVFQKVRDNYAGWNDKVTAQNQAEFDKLTALVHEKTTIAKTEKECYKAINEWIDFLKDGHVFLSTVVPIQDETPIAEVDARAAKQPQLAYNEASFQEYLVKNASKLKSIEGIWESDDKNYTLGIIQDVNNLNKFSAILLKDRDERWKAGKVKFEMNLLAPNRYSATYFYADFSGEKCLAREVKDQLVLENIYKFKKINPNPTEVASVTDIQQKVNDFRVEKLDEETALMVLPPFTMPDAFELISDLLQKNAEIINTSPNLIIDIRNNPGGDDYSYIPLFSYLYSGTPIVRQTGNFRATDENIIAIAHELEVVQTVPKYQERLVPKLSPVLRDMQSNIGSFVKGPDKQFNFGGMAANPKKVVILANKNTASTAENMIFEAKQSSKVQFFGENTKGLADYTDVRDWGLPCYGWRIAFALAKSPRLPNNPIDGVGIKPDVKISEETVDWVEFTRQYLKKSN
jgi:hypothetical protein